MSIKEFDKLRQARAIILFCHMGEGVPVAREGKTMGGAKFFKNVAVSYSYYLLLLLSRPSEYKISQIYVTPKCHVKGPYKLIVLKC